MDENNTNKEYPESPYDDEHSESDDDIITGQLSDAPLMYKVRMFCDEHSFLDFVVHVIKVFFKFDHPLAIRTALEAYNYGVATVVVCTLEIAEVRLAQVNDYTRKNKQSLYLQIEPSGS